MSILTNIKTWLYGAVGLLFSGLLAWGKWQQHKRTQAEEETEKQSNRANKYKDAYTDNLKVLEKAKQDAKIKEDIDNLDPVNVRDRLRKYARDNNEV